MKRDEDPTSSFDLFLDTICNTFGGIVFLAILLAIMIQNRSVVRTIEQSEQQATPEEVRELVAKLDALTAEQGVLQISLRSLPEPQPLGEDEAYFALAEQLQQAQSEAAEAVALQGRLARALAEQLGRNAVQSKSNEAVPEAHTRAERKLAEARTEFQRLVASKQETLRLPRERSNSAASALLLVQDDSIFLARTPTLFGRGFNAAQVTTTPVFDGGIRIDPVADTGWPLGTQQAKSQFQRVLQQARQDGHSLTVAVWPESYVKFVILREAMITAGVDYQLWPQSEGEPLIVYYGGGQSRVQ